MEWEMPGSTPDARQSYHTRREFGFRNGDAKWPDYYVDSFGAVNGLAHWVGPAFGYGAKFPEMPDDTGGLEPGKVRAGFLAPSASYTGEMRASWTRTISNA